MLFLYQSLQFIFKYAIPSAARYKTARILARLVYGLNFSRRQVLVRNLEPLVGPTRAKVVAPQLLANFAMTSVDFFCPRGELLRNLQVDHAEIVDTTLKRFKKVILVTAHIGNWELGMNYLFNKGYPMTGLYALYREDSVVRWILGQREKSVQWIPASRGAAQDCLQALENGRLLALAADIPFGEKGRLVPLAKGWTRMPLGPWFVAARAQAAVIPGFILRQRPGFYRLTFYDPILPASGLLRREVLRMQDHFRVQFERALLINPEQWGVLHPYWERT